MGATGQAFVDDGAADPAQASRRPTPMKLASGSTVPCDDARPSSPARAALERAAGRRAAAVPCAAWRPGRGAAASCTRRSTICTIRSCSPTWHRRSTAARRRSRAASGSPFTATTTSTASPRRSSCAARSSCSAATSTHFIPERLRDGYGLQPAAIDRLHADGVARDRLGRLRHPRHRSGAPRARARHRPDHHRPPRAGGDAAARARGDQSRSGTTAPIPTSTSPASASR